jgi:cathepsin L
LQRKFRIELKYIQADKTIFSASTLESQIFKKTNKLMKLSEQQLIECSWSYGNLGCKAGVIGYAYRYIINNGISRWNSYPYRATDTRTCSYNSTLRIANMTRYTWVPIGNEDFLRGLRDFFFSFIF